MTGQYNYRNYRSFRYLDNDQTTFAQNLRDAGYGTDIVGKWQLSGPWLDIEPSGPTGTQVTPMVRWTRSSTSSLKGPSRGSIGQPTERPIRGGRPASRRNAGARVRDAPGDSC